MDYGLSYNDFIITRVFIIIKCIKLYVIHEFIHNIKFKKKH